MSKEAQVEELYDSTVDDLIEWELGHMNLSTLQNFYAEEIKRLYYEHPHFLESSLQYMQERKVVNDKEGA